MSKQKPNYIYYAIRGDRKRQGYVSDAIQTAILAFESKWKVRVNSNVVIQPQSPVGEPCLQIADYMNWGVQRAFIKKEDRYFKFVEQKISFLVDIYDFDKYPTFTSKGLIVGRDFHHDHLYFITKFYQPCQA